MNISLTKHNYREIVTAPILEGMHDLNKRIVTSLYEAISSGNLAQIDALLAPDFAGGAATFRNMVTDLRTAVPDIVYSVDDLIAEDDRVVARFSWSGTHLGPFLSHAASGKRLQQHGIAIYSLQDGKITSAVLEANRLGFLQQLGVVASDAVLRAGPPLLDPQLAPEAVYLMDTFTVPAAARSELETAMRRNRDFIRTLPGFRGDAVLVRRQGGSFDLATIAVWESPDAIARAKDRVVDYYERIGFDMPAAIARWGVTMQRTICAAPADLQ